MTSEMNRIIGRFYFGDKVVNKVSEIFDGFSDESVVFYDPCENHFNVIDPQAEQVFTLDGRDDYFGDEIKIKSFDKFLK